MTRRELLLFLLGLGAAIAILAVAGGEVLWTRPLWFDELCCVVYVVGDASSPLEVVARIARSHDYAPPLLHLIVWSAARLAGGDVTPVLLHSVSLACVSLALLLVYATLRRRFGWIPSLAGTLAVAGHSLVIAHAFEGRFYGPWLLFAAGFAWSLGIDVGRRSRRRDLAIALFSIALVEIHWFGVLSLGLVCLAVFALRRRHWREGLRLIAPSIAGVILLLASAPLAITQRAGSTNLLWVLELNAAQVMEMAGVFWIAAIPLIAAAVVLLVAVRARAERPGQVAVLSEPSMVALWSLALMPVVLIMVSVVLQPSMVTRYAIVAVLAWAPLVALAITSLSRLVQSAAVAALVVLAVLGVQRVIIEKREFAAVVASNSTVFERAKAMQLPIVFWGLHNIYPVAGPQRSPRTLARYLDLPDSSITALFPSDAMGPVRKKYRLDRDQARGHARTYGFPILATQAQLDSSPRFLLLAADLTLPGGYKRPETFGRALFPRHRVVRINETLSLFERRP
jgi:hypothetical protein